MPETTGDTLVTNRKKPEPALSFSSKKAKALIIRSWLCGLKIPPEITCRHYMWLNPLPKGIYGHGDKSTGKWLPGPIRRPATLPVWSYSRGVRENDGYYIPTVSTALPDAVTGATPPGDFVVISRLSQNVPAVFDIYFEINQSWDWNEYWTNNKYPGDEDYKTSCQPALVYKARIRQKNAGDPVGLTLIGHSHYSGKDGEIYKDLSTITTAKNITKSAWVKMIP